MKYAVIDVGSNSVRLMIYEGTTISKTVSITKLAENMGEDNLLQIEAVERTVDAVSFFVKNAKTERVDKLFIFGTAALRRAKNSQIFTEKLFDSCGETIDIISGKDEAICGVLGALGQNDGGLIDIGGASTEIIVKRNGKIDFETSINIGAVTLFNQCKEDKNKAISVVKELFSGVKNNFNAKFFSVGGTATSLCSISQKMQVYNPKLIDGYFLSKKEINNLTDMLYSTSLSKRKKIVGLQEKRAEVIPCGSLILSHLIDILFIDGVTVSEKDNLEGYLFKREFMYE